MKHLMLQIRKFIQERDWEQFHSPKNLFLPLIIYILVIVLIVLFLYFDRRFELNLFSDIILILTVLILIWYTYETSNMRIINHRILENNNELLKKSKLPTVGFSVYNPVNAFFDTRFRIQNTSKYPVSCNVIFVFEFMGNKLPFSLKDYIGESYWNLQPNSLKEGHFNLMQVFRNHIIDSSTINKISKMTGDSLKINVSNYLKERYKSKPLNPLNLSVSVKCINEFGYKLSYLNHKFEYNFNKFCWIPIITSDVPYWDEIT